MRGHSVAHLVQHGSVNWTTIKDTEVNYLLYVFKFNLVSPNSFDAYFLCSHFFNYWHQILSITWIILTLSDRTAKHHCILLPLCLTEHNRNYWNIHTGRNTNQHWLVISVGPGNDQKSQPPLLTLLTFLIGIMHPWQKSFNIVILKYLYGVEI